MILTDAAVNLRGEIRVAHPVWRYSCAATVISSCMAEEPISASQHKPLSAENGPQQFGVWNLNLLLLEEENKACFGGVMTLLST